MEHEPTQNLDQNPEPEPTAREGSKVETLKRLTKDASIHYWSRSRDAGSFMDDPSYCRKAVCISCRPRTDVQDFLQAGACELVEGEEVDI